MHLIHWIGSILSNSECDFLHHWPRTFSILTLFRIAMRLLIRCTTLNGLRTLRCWCCNGGKSLPWFESYSSFTLVDGNFDLMDRISADWSDSNPSELPSFNEWVGVELPEALALENHIKKTLSFNFLLKWTIQCHIHYEAVKIYQTLNFWIHWIAHLPMQKALPCRYNVHCIIATVVNICDFMHKFGEKCVGFDIKIACKFC